MKRVALITLIFTLIFTFCMAETVVTTSEIGVDKVEKVEAVENQTNTENNKSAFIIGYHTFLGVKANTDIKPEVVKAQLQDFKNLGYTFITLNDFLTSNYTGTKNILVMVDDGQKSSYNAYYDIFKPLGIRPVYAISIGCIGGKYFLSRAQIRELKDSVDFSVHGYTHEKLSQKNCLKNKKLLNTEIVYSKKRLEKLVGKTLNTFTYCFGSYSNAVIAKLKESGYKYAFTVNDGRVEGNLGEEDFEIKRLIIDKKYSEVAIKYIKRHAGVVSKNQKKI